ncbi:MAG TPA: B-box zinc finger protein, partial [Mycobacterium sp.]|nr:B-box zinc finger protein [Mycobacterium sp.]
MRSVGPDTRKNDRVNQASAPQSPAAAPTCYRHPGRPTYIRCNRCDRYICTDCM